MKRKLFFFKALLFFTSFALMGCSKNMLEVEFDDIQKVAKSTSTELPILEEKTILYLDHSTSIIDAVKNSAVWNALFPNFTQYSDELILIKGSEFEKIVLDRQSNQIEQELKRIDQDIPWADIDKAVQEITKGNNQAIIVSDFEAFDNNSGNLETRTRDLVPYLTSSLKTWLEKGHSVYIITEPYSEMYKGKLWNKKRFYFIFSDDRLKTPIINNIKSQLGPLSKNGTYTMFKMTNSDLKVITPKTDMTSGDIDFSVKSGDKFDFISIESDWDAIREFVMKLDKYDESIPEEANQPILQNFTFTNGSNFKIENIKAVATNITADYVEGKKSIGGKDISDAFTVDEKALKSNKINVFLNKKIFSEGYLSGDLGGNLIRIDFVIEEVSIIPYDKTVFEWPSLYKNQTAICVSKSIENTLADLNVMPTNNKRKIFHTVFLKTQAYK